MLIGKQISGLLLLFGFKRVCSHSGVRQNTEMGLCGTVFECANRLRAIGKKNIMLIVLSQNHTIFSVPSA